MAAHGGFVDVPTVDLSAFVRDSAPGDRAAAAEAVARASEALGTFWVGLEALAAGEAQPPDSPQDSLQHRVVRACRDLFELVPAENKRELTQVKLPGSQIARGYIAYGSESGSKTMFENKEGFSYGYSGWAACANRGAPSEPAEPAEPDGPEPSCSAPAGRLPSNDLEGYNVWPPESLLSARHRSVLEVELFDRFIQIGNALVRAYSQALYGDESVLVDAWHGGDSLSLSRIFRYFCDADLRDGVDKEKFEAVLGSSPHTDWGLLTLIIADDTPGLQLFVPGPEGTAGATDNRSGSYRTVVPRFHEGKVLVNCGDFMSIASGGRFVSPLHRVISPSGELTARAAEMNGSGAPATEDRVSVVFFYYPKYDASIPEIKGPGKQMYSVFADQSVAPDAPAGRGGTQGSDMSFGSWISQKWASVARPS